MSVLCRWLEKSWYVPSAASLLQDLTSSLPSGLWAQPNEGTGKWTRHAGRLFGYGSELAELKYTWKTLEKNGVKKLWVGPTTGKRDSGVAVNHPKAQTWLIGNKTPARETSPVHWSAAFPGLTWNTLKTGRKMLGTPSNPGTEFSLLSFFSVSDHLDHSQDHLDGDVLACTWSGPESVIHRVKSDNVSCPRHLPRERNEAYAVLGLSWSLFPGKTHFQSAS